MKIFTPAVIVFVLLFTSCAGLRQTASTKNEFAQAFANLQSNNDAAAVKKVQDLYSQQ